MANTFEQVIELALRSTTDPNTRALLATLAEVGNAAGLTDEQVSELANEVKRLTGELADTAAAREAIKAYAELAKSQADVADAVDRAGLALKLSTEQEQAAAAALEEKNRALAEAKQAQADYATRGDRLVLVERELSAAVKDASADQRAANQTWKATSSELARATTDYEKAVDANDRLAGQLGALERTLGDAKLSTTDLAGAQRELAARTQASEKALAKLASESRETSTLAAGLAEETKRYRDEQDKTAASIERHRAKMAEARKETNQLGDATKEATGIFGSLRGMLAKLTGVFSVATIVQGLRAIVGAGSGAEQALAQLDAALASTGNRVGLTSKDLLQLANQLRDKSLFSSDQIVAAETRLLSYTDVAGKEFPRALQIAIDQAQRLGISTEQSAEIVGKALQSPADAMSALSRQGFKLEDGQKQLLLQLEATGRTAEAQAVIMNMLAESYGGAALAARTNTLAGVWKDVTDQVDDFLGKIADGGVLDTFKQRLKDLSDRLAEMVKDGRAAEWAKKIADGIVAGTDAMARGVRFIVEYAGAIRTVIEAYLILRGLKIAASLLESAAAYEKTRNAAREAAKETLAHASATKSASAETSGYIGAVGKLNGLLGALPQAVRFSIIAIGLDFTLNRLVQLKSSLEELGATNQRAKEISEDLERTNASLAGKIGDLKEAFQQYADVAIQRSDELRTKGEEQLVSYRQQLEGAQQYFRALASEARTAKDAVALAGAKERIAEIEAAIVAVNAQLAATRSVGTVAAGSLNEAASAIAARLKSVSSDAKETKEALAAIFTSFDLKGAAAGVGDFALAFDAVAAKGGKAAETLKSTLLASLKELSGQDLLRFQAAATSAMDAVSISGEKTSATLKATLEVALDRLGVKAEDTGVKITKAGTDTIATFLAVAQNATATAKQITAAFDAALGAAKTKEEAKALGEALKTAYDRGAVSARDLAIASRDVDERIRTITSNLSPLRSQFELLGIKSQAQLIAMRDNAREAFEAVVDGARRGEAAQEDVRRAFVAYAQAAAAAAADSNKATREQVALQLEIQASTLGLSDVLEKTGIVGQLAGEKTAEAFGGAKEQIEATGTAAEQLKEKAASAAEGISHIGAAASSAGTSLQNVQTQIEGIVLLSADQQRLMRSAWQEFINGAISAEEYERRIKEAMDVASTGLANSLQKQEDSLRKFQDTLADVNSEIAQMSGDDSAGEALRHERRLRDLQTEYEVGKELTADQYQQLIDAENKLHELKLQNLRKQRQEIGGGTGRGAGSFGGSGGEQAQGSGFSEFGSKPGASGGTSVNITIHSTVTDARSLDNFAREIKTKLDEIAKRSR